MSDSITAKNYKKLALQVSMERFSFCCFDTLSDRITEYESYMFQNHRAIEDELWKAFVEYPALARPYDEIVVLHDNSFNAFVPEALFDEDYLGSYLQYNTKVFETDFFVYDKVGSHDINNVHVPFVNINNFLIDQFGSFDYKNVNSILLSKLLDISKNTDENQVFIHLHDSHFEIIILRNLKLLLFNSFEYKTPEDFIYYLLFTLEQLQLNPEAIPVLMLGKTDAGHPCYAAAYTYIRNVSLLDVSALEKKWDKSTAEVLQHFILFNS